MAGKALSERLRHLLRYKRVDGRLVSYRSSTEHLVPLGTLVEQACPHESQSPRPGPPGCGTNGGVLYVLLLTKKILLAHFQLLCLCEELRENVQYAFDAFSDLCKAMESFNGRVSKLPCSHLATTYHHYSSPPGTLLFDGMNASDLKLCFGDVSEVFLASHSDQIVTHILKDPLPEQFLQQVRFETQFLRAFLGLIATHSRLLGVHKTAFVSKDAFSLAKDGHRHVTWLDCLIPGVQSEVLRNTEHLLLADLWSRVSLRLIASHFLSSSLKTAQFVEWLRNTAQQEDLGCHSAALKCLWHTILTLEQQKSVVLWDEGFQCLLATSGTEVQKGYRLRSTKTTKTTHLLLTQTLPHCLAIVKHPDTGSMHKPNERSSSFTAHHVDLLNRSHILCGMLQATTNAVAVFLVQGLTSALAGWKLKVLSQLLFVDGPMVAKELDKVVTLAGQVCSPRINFPPCCGFHLMECSSRQGYSTLHSCLSQLKEVMGGIGLAFHDTWSKLCRDVLKAVFPPLKFWKTLGKRNHLSELSPSTYCEFIKEQLIFPVVDAAESLAGDPQKAVVGFAMCILMNEFRRMLTSHKRAYRPGAGRQLLTDYRHLLHWVTSPELGLEQGTTKMLLGLPLLLEIEHGLLMVCGTANQDHCHHLSLNSGPSTSSSLLEHEDSFFLIPAHRLAVFTQPAWHSPQDWLQCIAS